MRIERTFGIDDPLSMRIAYSSQFSLHFRLTRVERTVVEHTVDYTSWQFNLRSIICHPTGRFTYKANDIYFHLSCFESFLKQLQTIEAGRTANLANEGEMVVFALHLDGRRLNSSIKISEYQPDNPLTVLSAGFELQDLGAFLNKLCADLTEFVSSLRGEADVRL
jgi:hypothetical protein